MSKEVQCPVCQKKYAVGHEMTGKRVRCRQCANVFTVPAPDAPVASEVEGFEAEVAAAAAPPTSFLDAAAQFENALGRDEKPKLRPSTRFKFPWAAQLDDFLPGTLVGVGFLWVIYETFHSPIGPIWAGLIRLAVVYGLYAGLVVPLTLMGIRKIALKLGYALPPQPAFRTAAVYALPVTLGYVTWVALEHPMSFAIGALLGLIFAAGAFWFLFRVDPQKELVPSFSVATGTFVGSLVACGLIMWVLNMVLYGSMKSSQAIYAVHVSPIGPTYAWNTEPPPLPHLNSRSDADSDNSTSPSQNPVQQARSPKPPVGDDNGQTRLPMPSNLQSSPGNPRTTDAAVASSSVKVSHDPVVVPQTPASQPSPSNNEHRTGSNTVFDIPNDDAPNTPRPAAPETASQAGESKLIADLKSRQLPFVRDVRQPPDIGQFDELVYPATTSSWFAVVRHKDANQDAVELRNANTFERSATVLFPREGNVPPGSRRYALSPDGQHMVEPATFPKPCFQVWSFKDQRVTRRIDMSEETGMPELIGFIDNDHFLIQSLLRASKVLQVRDVKSGLAQRTIPIATYAHTPGNGELTPDGKYFAIATRTHGQAELLLYDLAHVNVNPKSMVITGLGERWPVEPVGIAFSRDGSRVAAMFSNQGEAYVISWNIADRRVLTDQLCPGIAPRGGDADCGRTFEYIGNNALLVGGATIIDPATGRLLANLTDSPLKNQHFEDGNYCHLQYPDQGHSRLAVVELDPARLDAYSKHPTP